MKNRSCYFGEHLAQEHIKKIYRGLKNYSLVQLEMTEKL